MKIRTAVLSDSPAIAELLIALGYPGTETFIAAKIAQMLAHPDASLFVAVDKDCIAGFASLHFIPQLALRGDFCRVSYLCVAEQARSKGVGALLEQEIVAQARQRHCDRIELHCHSRRERAHHFYLRQGYVESPKYLMKLLT